MTTKTKYLIIGAGLTGLSAANHLSDNYLLVESSDFPGGTASTVKLEGFKLDNSVHVLYFRDNSIKNWIENILKVDLLMNKRISSVWINGKYVPFPLQYNLSYLPLIERIRCANSLIHSMVRWKTNKVRQNFEEYSQSTFGNYLTQVFVRPYNEQLFGVSLSELNTDWLGDYLPKSSRYKILLSAFRVNHFGYGRNSIFYYPREGGISTLAENLSDSLKLKPMYNRTLKKIILSNNTAVLNDDSEIQYDFLINTIPLADFLSKCDSLPFEILGAADCLKKRSTTLLHLLVKGKTKRKDHWIYIADSKIPFYRITFPGNINLANCPEGYFALTIEYGGEVLNRDLVMKESIATLKRIEILEKNNLIIEFYWRLIDCGYVIYDQHRKSVLEKIFPFLENNLIFSIGRYGGWEYSNMEDAILHGKNIAGKLSGLKKLH